jgi:FixJ family two-component response regulator
MIEISLHARAVAASPKPLVYVVDDDAGVLGSLRFLLETDGLAVRTFRSGAALLNAPLLADADCFLIDYKMPDINGIDLVGNLRAYGITAPAILITGYPDGRISLRAADAGVKHVLQKPILEESLVKHIREAIQEGVVAASGTPLA